MANNEEYTSLFLKNNSILENINTLDDLDLTLEKVTIINNPNLSICAVKRVCASLNLESAIIAISNNGAGCNSQDEVTAVCQIMGLEDFEIKSKILLALNPTTGIIEVTTLAHLTITETMLCSQFGQQLMMSQSRILDINHIARGIYFIEISTDKGIIAKKIVK